MISIAKRYVESIRPMRFDGPSVGEAGVRSSDFGVGRNMNVTERFVIHDSYVNRCRIYPSFKFYS